MKENSKQIYNRGLRFIYLFWPAVTLLPSLYDAVAAGLCELRLEQRTEYYPQPLRLDT